MEESKNKINIVAVVGPTASGKTSLGILLAKKLNGEIVSADSMQIYKGMDIATAKPTPEEKEGIVHHLMDFVCLGESFSVADYVKLANLAVDDIVSRGKIPIIVGGTGQYVDALLDGIKFVEQKTDLKIRQELLNQLELVGPEKMLENLKEIDPDYAKTLHANNTKRVLRGIEIYKTTGMTMSEQLKKSKETPTRFNPFKIGLCFDDRSKLYDRINKRVDIMAENGLLDEAKNVLAKREKYETAIQAIGYKELIEYFDGNISLDEALDNLKQQTRRYAKRQLTWFKRDKSIHWFDPSVSDVEDIAKESFQLIEKEFNI